MNPRLPLKPKKPRTAEEQNRLDAMSWYMTGQLHEKRNEFNEALDDYKKAVALDPDSVANLPGLGAVGVQPQSHG